MSAEHLWSATRSDVAQTAAAATALPMKIVFLSHTAMGGSFVVGSHHFAATLAASGHDVTHISAPLTPLHFGLLGDTFVRARWRRWFRGGAVIDGVTDRVPLTLLPWSVARHSGFLKNAYSRSMLVDPWHGCGSLRLGQADVLIIDEPRFVGLLPDASAQIVVYRPTDLYALMRGDPGIDALEQTLCARADVLVATSDGVASHLQRLSGRPVQVINNGVDLQRFIRPAVNASLTLPGTRADRAVYVGSFDARFSVEALSVAARALPHKHFILAGPGSEQIARIAPNIMALGPIEYSHVPHLLSQCAVGLLPFSASALNSARSPMKLHEYAAAGLAIAASVPLSPQSAQMPSLCVAHSEREFADAVGRAFEVACDDEKLAAARACSRSEGWQGKADRLLQLIVQAQAGLRDLADAAMPQPVAQVRAVRTV